MYCPSCGSEQIQGLKYCNRCGANLASSNDASLAKLSGMVWAVSIATALVGLGGFVIAFMIAIEILGRDSSTINSLLFAIVFLLVVLGISTLLIRQLSRLLGVYLKSIEVTQPEQSKLNEARTTRLPEPKETISNMEQETRRLEPSRREDKTY